MDYNIVGLEMIADLNAADFSEVMAMEGMPPYVVRDIEEWCKHCGAKCDPSDNPLMYAYQSALEYAASLRSVVDVMGQDTPRSGKLIGIYWGAIMDCLRFKAELFYQSENRHG